MSSLIELEKLALELNERERATLAANLLHSLTPILFDEDEGIAEALRRDAEMGADSTQGMSLAETMKFISINSRMILGVRYNEVTREMDIVFRTGEKYRYKKVPRSILDGLLSADSHGQFMHKKVLGHYEYERLD